jgi:hypothetical protein
MSGVEAMAAGSGTVPKLAKPDRGGRFISAPEDPQLIPREGVAEFPGTGDLTNSLRRTM